MLRTGRLLLRTVAWADLADLQRLKADPLVYGQMLGGVRHPGQVVAELAEDTSFWARHGAGMWIVHESGGQVDPMRGDGGAIGLVGLHERPDGRGVALRFAFTPECRGRGLAREAAGAALRHAHDQAGIGRVIAVAKQSNFGSRMVLGAIGMRECEAFERGGEQVLLYESLAAGRASFPSGQGVP